VGIDVEKYLLLQVAISGRERKEVKWKEFLLLHLVVKTECAQNGAVEQQLSIT